MHIGTDFEPPRPSRTLVKSRRELLEEGAMWSVAAAFALANGSLAHAQSAPPRFPGLIVRQRQPENLEFPFDTLDSFLTPNDRFYIRSHFAVPTLEAGSWRLKVEGAVERPFEVGYDDLLRMESRTRPATLECAGNGRVYLAPSPRGVQWELGAVSTAEWTGVPLAAILNRAGVKTGAVDVVLEGADSGEIKDPPKPAGAIHFARSLPLSKALNPDTLLAFKMNSAELPQSHGFPVRAVVPGWYGVASVKWLTRIVVTESPYQGHFQTVDYATFDRREGLPVRVPISEMQVKASIARPVIHEIITAGKPYTISGAAWSGEKPIQRVDISTDGGASWSQARLTDRSHPHSWRLWSYAWRSPTMGKAVLMARATDAAGRVQPMQRDPDRDHYMISHVLPIEVEVR
jgi:DMSO/TMAO reductase YedYZ molybdopterin-dependent catalytic subunit